jgi:SAM-dependent methyltransferase
VSQRLDDLKHRVWRSSPVPAPVRRVLWRWRNPPSPFVSRHLDGMIGVEIGASAHNDYGLRAINVDRFPELDSKYKREELNLCGTARAVDLVAAGDDLPFRDETVDFVFASHVIEHFPDPIAALDEWCRVAKHRVVLVVPHRDRTLDAHRDLTSTEELLERHTSGFTSEEDKHWSVWTRETFLELCEAAGFPVVDSLDPDDKLANGFAVVIDAAAAREPDRRRRRAISVRAEA